MNLDYVVHRVSSHPFLTEVALGEEKIQATVRQVEVELTCEGQGTITWRFLGAAGDKALAQFAEGSVVSIPVLKEEA